MFCIVFRVLNTVSICESWDSFVILLVFFSETCRKKWNFEEIKWLHCSRKCNMKFYMSVDNLSTTLYPEHLLLSNCLECVERATPTSQIYASYTVILMFTEYHVLWRCAALQCHNLPKKIREYKWSSSCLGVDAVIINRATTWHLCRKIAVPGYNLDVIHENYFKIVGKLPCDIRSTNLFQSC
jgi:hypothetical protein